jgi:hypothetical protein
LRRFAKQFMLNPAVEANRQPEVRPETGRSAAPDRQARTGGKHIRWQHFFGMDPRIRACEKTWRFWDKSAVKAALDMAIHDKHRAFNRLVDDRVRAGQEEVTLFYSQSLSRECPLRFLCFRGVFRKTGKATPRVKPEGMLLRTLLSGLGS